VSGIVATLLKETVIIETLMFCTKIKLEVQLSDR